MKTNVKIAVIDVGSNSVRLMTVFGKNKSKKNIITRLAEGAAFSGELSEEAIERTVAAVKTFYNEALISGVEEIYIFATAAVRNNKGGSIFCEKVYNSTGLSVDVLSGDEEASAGAYGALYDGEKIVDGGLIDIGGGSSEICVYCGGEKVYSHSLKSGAANLYDLFGKDRNKIEEFCFNAVKEYGQIPNSEFYAVGGSATSVAAILLKLRAYDAEKVHGFKISVDDLYNLLEELYLKNAEELSMKYCIQPKRAEIIAGGATLLYSIMKMLGVKFVTACEHDNLEGYLVLRGI